MHKVYEPNVPSRLRTAAHVSKLGVIKSTVIQESMSIKQETASELLHIYVKELFPNSHLVVRDGEQLLGILARATPTYPATLYRYNLWKPKGNLPLHRKMQRFQGGLVFKAHGLVYHSA